MPPFTLETLGILPQFLAAHEFIFIASGYATYQTVAKHEIPCLAFQALLSRERHEEGRHWSLNGMSVASAQGSRHPKECRLLA